MKKDLDTKNNIIILGAKEHNLKNIDVSIPRNKLVVITGLSGSGKSSLAFDTLYAEGQRRYVESLSSYARQFLGKIEKPNVDHVHGISPAIAIEQKVTSKNSRSTVGTTTEIFDYLKLLYTKVGKTISPISGKEVKKDTIDDVTSFIESLTSESSVLLKTNLELTKDKNVDLLSILSQQGYNRIAVDDKVYKILDLDTMPEGKSYELVIDRFSADLSEEANLSRIKDSVEIAFFEGRGKLTIAPMNDVPARQFSNQFDRDGIKFEVPSLHFFSFNNPVGACKKCEGFGSIIGIDQDLVIPNKSLSIYDDAVMCWKGEKMSEWKHSLVLASTKFDFPIHKPIYDLTEEQLELLWTGNEHFKGLNDFFKFIEEKSYKIQYRVMLSRYRGKTKCNDCNGTRLRKDAQYVKVGGKSISEITSVSIKENLEFFLKLKLGKNDAIIADRLLLEIRTRIQFLADVGLGYLTLERQSSTLSGGESQRINLATSLGSTLVGSMYILDEPSIGLHSKDTERLVHVLKSLKNLGNTVIVVEHDEDIMREADLIIDLGPEAGRHGGELMFQGTHKDLIKSEKSLTAKYLTNRLRVEVPKKRRKWSKSIKVIGACENNLKGIDVEFPLNILCLITGISGSGKSSLVKTILLPCLKKHFDSYNGHTIKSDKIAGDLSSISRVEYIDQNPIGKSSRSNPITYIKAYDDIRNLYSDQQSSKINGYRPSHFSFNVDGGRCEMCEGEGINSIEMQFMADIHLTCEACNGQRFKDEILEVAFRGKNIYELLCLSVNEAIEFFDAENSNVLIIKRIIEKLKTLQDVGLGYVQLGQASSTLSGGEAQRIKLASYLDKGTNSSKKPILFIFDEPSTGLHFHDIKKLLGSMNRLIDLGHSIIVIEHNLDIVKCADWVIDLGPEGGSDGGELLFAGTPEGLAKCKRSYTAKYLKEKLR
ncbi:MAG: excinuclease ABC subunit A [Rhodospirillaceae bacterium]|nr:MAG: excinuclease ABC subunit A [Rhodospirillaceae bacterium]